MLLLLILVSLWIFDLVWFGFGLLFVWLFDTRPHYAAQTGLIIAILLHPLSECKEGTNLGAVNNAVCIKFFLFLQHIVAQLSAFLIHTSHK